MALKEELKKRVDAAQAYADLNQQQLADGVEQLRRARGAKFSRSTFNRRRDLTKETKTFDEQELREIAEVCGVPLWFLTDGWKGWLLRATPERVHQIAEDLPDLPPDE